MLTRKIARNSIYRCSLVILLITAGCANNKLGSQTLGESSSGYTYVPIDPNRVMIASSECSIGYSDIQKKKINILNLLPDNAVRMSMELSDLNGNVTYGVSKIGSSNSTYKLTADYVNSDTVNKTVWIRRTMLINESESTTEKFLSYEFNELTVRKPVPLRLDFINKENGSGDSHSKKRSIPGTEQYDVKSFDNHITADQRNQLEQEMYEEFSVPIYVGIGLRIVAEGKSFSSDANISGIGIVGAEADAKKLSGALTVQTLGVNSQSVASALPVQSELSRTTAENAFVAIGSIKAMLHQPDTIIFPRVVGLYLPFPGGKPLVNALISELSKEPVTWCPSGYAK